jgi:excisionase family DNA binding protein
LIIDTTFVPVTTWIARSIHPVLEQTRQQVVKDGRRLDPRLVAFFDEVAVLAGREEHAALKWETLPVDGSRPLLRSREVAELFCVTERTVANWAKHGKLPCLRTAGGHLRFRVEDISALRAQAESEDVSKGG